MDKAAALLNLASKKDDSAQLIMSGGSVFLQTSSPMPRSNDMELTVSMPNPSDEGLLESAAVAARPDIRIQSIYTMFVAHTIAIVTCLVLALPLYYMHPPHLVAGVLLSVCCALQAICFIAMLFARKRHVNVAFGFYIAWVIIGAPIVSCIAVLLGNAAPFQFLAIVFMQSLAVVIYTKMSPRMISTIHALIYMLVASVVVWGISIASFVIEHDWLAGTVVLILSVAAAAYHAFQIRVSEAHGYNMSWDDTVLSIIQFYGDPVLLSFDQISSLIA